MFYNFLSYLILSCLVILIAIDMSSEGTMKHLVFVKSKLFLFLISGILSLSLGFVLISCGAGPALKTLEVMAGIFGIDFSLTSDPDAYITVASSNFPSIDGQQFTVEAWIKPKSSTVKAPIFSHVDSSKGILVFIYNNVLAARIGYGSDSSSASTVATESGDVLTANDWNHIAVVMANEAHSHTVDPDDCTPSEMIETPHIDIYINGVLKACGTTGLNFAQDPTGDDRNRAIIGYTSTLLTMETYMESGPLLSFDPKLNAVIDDVRFWLTARTTSEISQCYNQALVIGSSGTCGAANAYLYGYWALNAGIGTYITDTSGRGISGSLYSPVDRLWSGGWTTGKN